MSRKHDDGKRDGAAWAKAAEVGDLKRLDREVRATDLRGYGNGSGTPESFVEVSTTGNSHGLAPNLYEAIFGDGRPSSSDLADFWENVIDLGRHWPKVANDAEYATGFIEGCLEEVDRREAGGNAEQIATFSAGLTG